MSVGRTVDLFTAYRKAKGPFKEWRDLMNAQATGLAAVWDNSEDKVWDDV